MDGAHKIKGEASQCLVCCHPAGSCHFGSVSCLACAAFFRRTVSLNIVFVCKKEKSCSVFHELRMICRACRFEQCLAAGLRRDLVQQRRLARRKSSVCQRKETVIKATREHCQRAASSSSSLPPNSILSNMTSPEEQHLSPVYENIGTEESVPSSSSILSPSPQDESPPSSNTTDTSAVPLPILGMDGPDLLEHYRKEKSGSINRNRAVCSYDAETGVRTRCINKATTGRPNTMCMLPVDAKAQFATGDDGGEVCTWDFRVKTPLATKLNDQEEDINALAIDLDGCLLSASSDGTLASYDGRYKKLKMLSEMQHAELLSLCVTNKYVYCGSSDGHIEVFKHGEYGNILERIESGFDMGVHQINELRTGLLLTSSDCDSKMRLLHVMPTKRLGAPCSHGDSNEGIDQVVISPDRTALISMAGMANSVKLWSLQDLLDEVPIVRSDGSSMAKLKKKRVVNDGFFDDMVEKKKKKSGSDDDSDSDSEAGSLDSIEFDSDVEEEAEGDGDGDSDEEQEETDSDDE